MLRNSVGVHMKIKSKVKAGSTPYDFGYDVDA
jgi:hypothetical protein